MPDRPTCRTPGFEPGKCTFESCSGSAHQAASSPTAGGTVLRTRRSRGSNPRGGTQHPCSTTKEGQPKDGDGHVRVRPSPPPGKARWSSWFRTPDSRSGDHRFESGTGHERQAPLVQRIRTLGFSPREIAGSNPVRVRTAAWLSGQSAGLRNRGHAQCSRSCAATMQGYFRLRRAHTAISARGETDQHDDRSGLPPHGTRSARQVLRKARPSPCASPRHDVQRRPRTLSTAARATSPPLCGPRRTPPAPRPSS